MNMKMTKWNRLLSLMLCLMVLLSVVGGSVFVKAATPAKGRTPEVSRVSDPETMDSYQMLDDKNGTRYAGRIWSDKSVFSYDELNGSLNLDVDTDGVNGKVEFNEDFLHAFSVMGSTQQYAGQIPTNLVIVIDNSGSMYTNNKTDFKKTRIYKTVEAVNSAIDAFMEANTYNEISVVLFGDGGGSGTDTAKTIIPMGRYAYQDGEGHKPYLTADWVDDKSGGYVKVDNDIIFGKSGTTNYKNGTTNIQAGIYQGMKELLNADNKKAVLGNVTVERMPSLVVLTDGQATDALVGDWSNPKLTDNSLEALGFLNNFSDLNSSFVGDYINSSGSLAYSWNQFVEIIPNDKNYLYNMIGGLPDPNNKNFPTAEGKKKLEELAETYQSSESYLLLTTLMTAGYMKKAVSNAYNQDCSVYTISVDMPDPTGSDFGPSSANGGITSNGPMMNPNVCFNNEWLSKYIKNDDDGTFYEKDSVGSRTVLSIADAITAWSEWKGKSDGSVLQRINCYRSLTSGTNLSKAVSPNGKVGAKEVIKNYTGSPSHSNFWIAGEKTLDVKIPHLNSSNNPYHISERDIDVNYANLAYYASASEDAAHSIKSVFDQIMDTITNPPFIPVGGTNDAGVNNSLTYMDPIGKYMEVKDVKNISLFGELYGVVKSSVYDHSFIEAHTPSGGTFRMGWYNSRGTYLGTAQGAGSFDKGDTYYLSDEAAKMYVPTLIGNEEISEKQLNTVYTLYRFNLDEKERKKTRYNPCYGEDSEETYILDDIIVWTEDTQNYIDDSELVIDNEFDQALYINIPASALPLQKATVTLNSDGDVESYETNLDNKTQTTPLRVFYTVGLSDYIMNEKGDDVDLTKISQEYLDKNTAKDGSLYFYSNYYSATNYDGYSALSDQTRGDPVITFSPGRNNRYYVFQKALPLYAHAYEVQADGSIKRIDSNNGDGEGNWSEGATWDGEIYDGEFKDENEVKQAFLEGKVKVGNAVFLSKDALENITAGDSTAIQLNSKNYYFMLSEYYIPTSDGKGEFVRRVITRRGGEFGEEITSDFISSKDMLCWHDANEIYSDVYPYRSSATTGDKSRGRDYIGYTFDENGNPIENDSNRQMHKELMENGRWILSAAPGGLRMGNLEHSVNAKKSNATGTSSNYYLPTVSSNSTVGDGIIINSYLGNNGRLAVANTMLLITKEVQKSMFDSSLSPDEEFNFEAYVKGITGSHNVIRIGRNSTTGDWQRRISTIDILTDNQGLLQSSSHNLVTVNEKCEQDEDGKYYVYIGNNAKEAGDQYTFRLYISPEASKETGEDFPDRAGNSDDGSGNTVFYVKDVYLIPKSEADNTDWSAPEYSDIISRYGKIDNFTVATLYPSGFGSASGVKSDYNIITNYLTETLDFDSNNKASFKLKDGEGILFNGLKLNTGYTVQENLSVEELEQGYDFARVKHVLNQSSSYTYNKKSENNGDPANPSGTGFVKDTKNNSYLVLGDTAIVEEAVHFGNSAPNNLKEETSPGADLPVKLGSEIEYEISWKNSELTPADVVIKDKLDPGVDYLDNSAKYVYFDESGKEVETSSLSDCTVAYDAKSHSLLWRLKNRDSGDTGKIKFKVVVNEKAVKEWKYDNDNYDDTPNTLGDAEDNKVFNRAVVAVGDNEWVTNTIVNPIWSPEKTEVDPGDKKIVQVGDTITYEVSWKNYRDKTADVEVMDRLDPGVDYIDGTADFIFLDESGNRITDEAKITSLKDGCSATYDKSSRTIIWELKNRPSDSEGKVTFKVTVNNDALKDDEKVLNQASVKVANDPWQDTNIVENPVPHEEKEEVDPGDNKGVKINDVITYRVHWKNSESGVATVVIKDPLDKGLDYVDKSANFGGFYDNYSRTVIWELKDKPSGSEGWVSFKAKVNENAVVQSKVENQATVQVGHIPEVKTNIVENPTWEPHKTEVTPGDGRLVDVGEKITYKITWKNYKSENATVVITDPLDTGVDFVNASDDGKYDSKNHTVVWTFENQPAGKEGAVTLTVKTNSTAAVSKLVENQASVKVSNDPEQYTEIVENPLEGLGNLSVDKTVVGISGLDKTEFTFKVEFTHPNGIKLDKKYSYKGSSTIDGVQAPADGTLEFTEKDGVYSSTFKLMHGQRITINGIQAGTKYTVTEIGRNGYNLKSKQGTEDSVKADKTMNVSFVNSPAPVLPEMGGIGTLIFIISGVLVLLTSLPIIYYKVRRKRG